MSAFPFWKIQDGMAAMMTETKEPTDISVTRSISGGA